MGSRVYAGRTASTRKERVVYRARAASASPPTCGAASTRATAGEAKSLHRRHAQPRALSRRARRKADVQVTVVFHDGAHERLVLVLPDGLRHRELQRAGGAVSPRSPTTAWRRRRYVLEPEVVFGAAGLRALLAPPPTEAAPSTPRPSRGLRRRATGRRRRPLPVAELAEEPASPSEPGAGAAAVVEG